MDKELKKMAQDYEAKKPRRIAFWVTMGVIIIGLLIAIFSGTLTITLKTNYEFIDLNGETGTADHCETSRGQLYCTTYSGNHTWRVQEYWRKERVDE